MKRAAAATSACRFRPTLAPLPCNCARYVSISPTTGKSFIVRHTRDTRGTVRLIAALTRQGTTHPAVAIGEQLRAMLDAALNGQPLLPQRAALALPRREPRVVERLVERDDSAGDRVEFVRRDP